MTRDNSDNVRWQPKAGGSEASLDAWFASGYESSLAIAHYDRYPSLEDQQEGDGPELCLSALELLDDELRAAVEMTVVAGMTLGEAAEALDWRLSTGDLDRKRVKRARDVALAELADLVGGPHSTLMLTLYGQPSDFVAEDE